MLDQLSSRMLEKWPVIFPGDPKPERLTYIILPGSVENGTVSFLAFKPNSSNPCFAAKARREKGGVSASVNAESAVLARLSADTRLSVPRELLRELISGRIVTASAIVPGLPMAAPIDDAGRPELKAAEEAFVAVSEWLARLQDLGSRSPEICQELIRDGRYQISKLRGIGRPVGVGRLIALVEDNLDALAGPGSVAQHGDFCRQNLLVSGGGSGRILSVIDWSDAKTAGFALHDLFFFLSTYFIQSRRRPGVEGLLDCFAYTYLEENSYSALVRRCVTAACRTVGLAPHLARPSLARFLIEQSVQEARKVRECMDQGTFPRLTVALSVEFELSYAAARDENFWLHCLGRLSEKYDDCIL